MTDPEYQTDTEFMLAVLRRGPATTSELIEASYAARGCRFTPHSRASDLRRRLEPRETVRCEHVGRVHGRNVYRYSIEPVLVVEESGQLALELAVVHQHRGAAAEGVDGAAFVPVLFKRLPDEVVDVFVGAHPPFASTATEFQPEAGRDADRGGRLLFRWLIGLLRSWAHEHSITHPSHY